MEHELSFLLEDPRPDLPADSRLWRQLFLEIPKLPIQAAIVLSPQLWSLRAWGTQIRRTHVAAEFVPVMDEKKGWSSVEEYLEIKQKYLRPYAQEIYHLLSSLE